MLHIHMISSSNAAKFSALESLAGGRAVTEPFRTRGAYVYVNPNVCIYVYLYPHP